MEKRDKGTPPVDLVPDALDCEADSDMSELIEALYLGYLEPQDEARARALLDTSAEARAYWSELSDASGENDEVVRAIHEKLVARMPWLMGVEPAKPEDLDLATLRMPQPPEMAEPSPAPGDAMADEDSDV